MVYVITETLLGSSRNYSPAPQTNVTFFLDDQKSALHPTLHINTILQNMTQTLYFPPAKFINRHKCKAKCHFI